MPIGFRTKNLSIETFRGLRDLQVDFPGDSPLYLIGTNNACKSTVLEAIAMAPGRTELLQLRLRSLRLLSQCGRPGVEGFHHHGRL
jgi:recombinational DNA repair ATPase RecF